MALAVAVETDLAADSPSRRHPALLQRRQPDQQMVAPSRISWYGSCSPVGGPAEPDRPGLAGGSGDRRVTAFGDRPLGGIDMLKDGRTSATIWARLTIV
jgi:hypothetical protein